MMNDQDKTRDELIKELQELHKDQNTLMALYEQALAEPGQVEHAVMMVPQEHEACYQARAIRFAELQSAKQRAEARTAFVFNSISSLILEMQSTMHGIDGLFDLAYLADFPEPEQREYFKLMKESGCSITKILTESLEALRITAGQTRVNLSEILLHRFLGDIYSRFASAAEVSGILFSLEIPESSAEPVIKSDREMLTSVFVTLVGNAVKYTEKGFVSFGYTPLVDVSKGKTVEPVDLCLFVRDTGIGFFAGEDERLNNWFDKSCKSPDFLWNWFGNGLSVTKVYVEMLGGTIHLESDRGKGSSFIVTIPVNI